MDIWRSSMDDLYGRLSLTIFLDDFTVYWRLHWLSVVLLSMYTIPFWVILCPNCSVSSRRLLGRTRVGLVFLLPYQLPLCSRGRPGYCCDFKESFTFCEPRVAKPLVGWLCRSHFLKELLRVNFWMANVASVTLLLGPINSTIPFHTLHFPLNFPSAISSKSLV